MRTQNLGGENPDIQDLFFNAPPIIDNNGTVIQVSSTAAGNNANQKLWEIRNAYQPSTRTITLISGHNEFVANNALGEPLVYRTDTGALKAFQSPKQWLISEEGSLYYSSLITSTSIPYWFRKKAEDFSSQTAEDFSSLVTWPAAGTAIQPNAFMTIVNLSDEGDPEVMADIGGFQNLMSRGKIFAHKGAGIIAGGGTYVHIEGEPKPYFVGAGNPIAITANGEVMFRESLTEVSPFAKYFDTKTIEISELDTGGVLPGSDKKKHAINIIDRLLGSESGHYLISATLDNNDRGFWYGRIKDDPQLPQPLFIDDGSGGSVETDVGNIDAIWFSNGLTWISPKGTVFLTNDLGIWKFDTDNNIRKVFRPGDPLPGTEWESSSLRLQQGIHINGFDQLFFEALGPGFPSPAGLFVAHPDPEVGESGLEKIALLEDLALPDGPAAYAPTSFWISADNGNGSTAVNDTGQITFGVEYTHQSNSNLTEDAVFIAQATILPGQVLPLGDDYIWDGGAGTNNWHTVTNGRSNWVDSAGTPWPTPPGSGDSNEKCFIGTNFAVELNSPVSINSLRLEAASLDISADLQFFSLFETDFLSELHVEGGSVTSNFGVLNAEGLVSMDFEGVFTFDIGIFNLKNSNLVLENGLLRLMNNETWINHSSVQVNSGILNIEGPLTRFRGDSATATVVDGELNLLSQSIQLDTNTVLDAKNESSVLNLGDGGGSSALSFNGGSAESKRKLELNGEGRIEIRTPMTISENEELEVNHTAPWDREGVVINLPEGQAINVTGEWFSRKDMRLQRGGILGNFWNDGVLILKTENGEGPLQLAGTNVGRIQQYSNVQYVGELKNRPASVYQIFGGNLVPANPETDTLIFENRGQLWAEQGEILVDFGQTEERAFGEFVEVRGSAKLSLLNANMKGKVLIRVLEETGEITLQETVFEKLFIEGEGLTNITGILHGEFAGGLEPGRIKSRTFPEPPYPNYNKDPVFYLKTKKYNFESAVLTSGDDTLPEISASLFSIGDYSLEGEYSLSNSNISFSGILKDVTVGRNVTLLNSTRNTMTIESPIILQGGLFNNGVMMVKNDLGNLPYPGYIENYGTVSIPQEQPNEIFIWAAFANAPGGTVSVGENSRVSFYFCQNFDYSYGTLSGVNNSWIVESGASLLFIKASQAIADLIPITKINRLITIKIGAPPSNLPSINGFPTRDSDLTIEGGLYLENHQLVMPATRSIEVREGGRLNIDGKDSDLDLPSVIGDIMGTIPPSSMPPSNGSISIASSHSGPPPVLGGDISVLGDTHWPGIIEVGSSSGRARFDGDLWLEPTSVTRIGIGGLDAGVDYDQIEVTGTAQLKGKLVLYSVDGYEAPENEPYTFVVGPNITGGFTEIDQSRLGRNVRFDFSASESGTTATAVPLTIASYADWRGAFFTESDAADDLISGPDQDPEGDNYTNFMEYVLGGNPNIPEDSLVAFTYTPSATPGEYDVSASFNWAKDVTDASWTFERSNDLETWTEVESAETSNVDNGDFSAITVSLMESIAASQKTFLRIRVNEQTP